MSDPVPTEEADSVDDFKEKADNTLAALRTLRRSGEITIELYCKMVINLCLEYVKQNQVQDVIVLVRGLPSEYFEETIAEQMKEDADFCEVAYTVACAMIDSLDTELESPEVNMKGGLA